MELAIVKFLKQFKTVEEAVSAIKEKYAIHVNASGEHPNLLQFKYDQIDSPTKKQLVQEARGIILDSTDDWRVIAYPFNRFFNHGDSKAAKIDWETASIWEKVDGSLMFMYWYKDAWHVASSGLPDAAGMVKDADVTFKDLFWNTWGDLGYAFPLDKYVTHMFELTTPENVVVVPQGEHKITFIGARDIQTGVEYSIDNELFPNGWHRPRRFAVTSEENAIEMCNQMNPMEQEGFVIVDRKFNRVKMKSPQYAAIAHLGLTKEQIIEKGLDLNKYDENLQLKWMLKIILTNEGDEFLVYYPQYEKMYKFLRETYDRFIGDLEAFYGEVKDIEAQWDYANKVKSHPLSGIFFQLKNGRIGSVMEGVRNTDIKKLLKVVKAY